MAYTPELTESASATLRRIAWAVNKPMTQTLSAIFMRIPNLMDRTKVCDSCRDPSACNICGFNGKEAA
jgi:recombinational DNA repair protein RecR